MKQARRAWVAIVRPWRGARDWLRDVPVADEVDRRNAPTLQIVLLLLASTPPLAWLYRAAFSPLPWRPGEFASMCMSLALSVLAALCCGLIRRGRFQAGLRVPLLMIAVSLMAAYATQGMAANRYEAVMQVVWLIIAGLMAGRRALWLMYAWIALAFAVGTLVDVRAGGPDPWPALAVDGVINALIMLFVAVVVDRSAAALRESLAAATARGNELAQAKARLEAEITERERLYAQLIHSQKIEAVGRLATGVAHDFNHLLSLILGYAAQGRNSGDIAKVRQALDGVDAAARRASAVSRKLLTFGHRGETTLVVFDVNAALAEMQPMLRQLLGPEVRIAFEPARDAPEVCMDLAQFELVVLNLAANAGAAMPQGGRFSLSVHSLAQQVELRFSDNGHGMDEVVCARAFEPFFTTRAAGEGTGLGLAVAADVVAARGGRLVVDSVPGQGTTLRMQLPRAAVAAEALAATDCALLDEA